MTKNPQQNIIKIEIKNRCTKEVIFSHECEDNTIRKTVEQALKSHIDLSSADLSSADLSHADLSSADLSYADLSSSDLRYAKLNSADLSHAELNFADLSYADLRFVDIHSAHLNSADLHSAGLHSANISNADLSYAELSFADLSSADLSYAKINSANLRFADLRKADLNHTDLNNTDLYSVNLRITDLSFADLRNANLRDADLRDAVISNETKIDFMPLACPSDGAFIGWKKVEGKLVKLLIPEDARRFSATTNKCRCDKAQVLSITDIDGNNPIDEIINRGYAQPCKYKVGEFVIPDSFDENRWNECSNGIHFFINKQEAINY